MQVSSSCETGGVEAIAAQLKEVLAVLPEPSSGSFAAVRRSLGIEPQVSKHGEDTYWSFDVTDRLRVLGEAGHPGFSLGVAGILEQTHVAIIGIIREYARDHGLGSETYYFHTGSSGMYSFSSTDLRHLDTVEEPTGPLPAHG